MAQDRTDGYQPGAVERKWQAIWEEQGTNRFTREELLVAPQPFYNLMMFPYPSAEGLHVGNIYAFTGADVHGRYQRLTGTGRCSSPSASTPSASTRRTSP